MGKQTSMEKATQPDNVSSVLKVFNILQLLAEQKDISITELADKLMMSKSTTYRFLTTMKNLGFVQQAASEKYGLTLKLFELGAKALEYNDLISLADKEMAIIAQQTHETLHLGALEDAEIVYLHKIDSSYNLRMYSRIGRRNPAYSTAIGKILLSQYSNEEVAKRLQQVELKAHTPHTLTSLEQLYQALEQIRQQHYALDNEEQEEGIICLAVPVYDRFAKIIAALSMSLPTVRFEPHKLPEFIQLLHKAGKKLSEQLGFHAYPV